MNTHSAKLGTALSTALLASGLFLTGAQAQSPRSVGRANVPFAFQYNHHNFSAGEYTIRMESDNIMAIGNQRNTALGLVQRADTVRQPKTGKLVFARVGDRYALQDVWLPSSNLHLHLSLPKQPKHPELVQVTPNQTTGYVELAIAEVPR